VQEQCCEGNDEQQERRPAAEQSGTRVPTPPPWGHARNNDRHANEGANVDANADSDVDVPELFRRASVTPAFLAPNKAPNKSCVFSKLSSRAQLPPSNPSHCPSLSPRRACRESRRHRPHPGQRPRVPSQRRSRPPCRESRARRGPAGRSASPSPPSRKMRRRPKIGKIPQNPSANFPSIFLIS
jgi:hypothetical protein